VTGSIGGGRGRRSGSRLLLAAALLLGIAIALSVGARLSDFLSDAAGFESRYLRLGLKVLFMAVALPVGFYLVERFFLNKARGRS
jgi:hypothetical protein